MASDVILGGGIRTSYYRDSRFRGRYELDIDLWSRRLEPSAVAVRANAYICQTFYILLPKKLALKRAGKFADRWTEHKVSLHVSC